MIISPANFDNTKQLFTTADNNNNNSNNNMTESYSDLRLSTEEEQMLFASIAMEASDEGGDFVLPRTPTPTNLPPLEETSASEEDDNDDSENFVVPDLPISSSARIAQELLKLDEGFADDKCTIPTEDVIGAVRMADPDELDTILADEMSKMSMEEQRKATQDVYGISAHIVEDPTHVESQLAAFRDCLTKIPQTQDKEAYEQALYINPTYVNDRKFHLMFLRSEKFDAEKVRKERERERAMNKRQHEYQLANGNAHAFHWFFLYMYRLQRNISASIGRRSFCLGMVPWLVILHKMILMRTILRY